jgi:hypothetical protein
MRKLKRALTRHKKGMSLIGTLLVGSLMLTLGFTAAAMTFSHFTLTNVAERQSVCRSLAEAAANRAIARCLADITYGTKGNIGDDITVTLGSAPDGWGKVYFGGSDPVAFGNIPKSNNFLAQDLPNQSTGRVVPSRSLHVIAIGQWGKTRRAVETIVSIPKFKYAIASSGQVTSSGGLLVAGVKNPGAVEKGVSKIPDDQWAPGCMMSNSSDVSAALDLDSGALSSRITGDVQAVGGIKLGTNTVVEGSVKPFNSPQDVPKVKATDYDTAGMAGCNTTIGANEMGLNVVGPARRAGDLTVTGGLNMDSGILYVDGDVTVYGGLHGKGALISTGKVTIANQSQFHAADDQAAIVAQSDVKISGSDKDNCVYNGVVFTQGDFQANDVTLLGSLCAGKASGSAVKLNQVNMLSNPISMDLQYSIEGPLSDHVMNWRRDRNVDGYVNGKLVDPATTPPVTPGGTEESNLSISASPYSQGGNMQITDQNSPGFTALIQKYNADATSYPSYNLAVGSPRGLMYNSDYSVAWDSAANGGRGGFTPEKLAKAYPLGLFDGNASIRLEKLPFERGAYAGGNWAFDHKFTPKELYGALRSESLGAPGRYKLINRDNPSQSVTVSLAEVFDPDGDAATRQKWGSFAAKKLWWGMTYPHWGMWGNQMPDLSDPLPATPWDNLPAPEAYYANGYNALTNWLNSQTTFYKPQYKGSFNFNPLQFVQLRDQSQRMLWREYDPG